MSLPPSPPGNGGSSGSDGLCVGGGGSHENNKKVKSNGLTYFAAVPSAPKKVARPPSEYSGEIVQVKTTPGSLPHSRAAAFRERAMSSKYVARLGISHAAIDNVTAKLSTVSSVGLLGQPGYVDLSSSVGDGQHKDQGDEHDAF